MASRHTARAVACVLVFSGIAALAIAQSRTGSAGSAAHAASSGRFDWPIGRRDVFAVRWQGTSLRDVPGGDAERQLGGAAVFEGDVSVRSLGKDVEGRFTLAYGIEAIREYGLAMDGKELVSDADRRLATAALVGQEAIVHTDDRGVVAAIAYHQDTAPSTRELLRRLVDMMRVTLPERVGSPSWNAHEPTPNGLATVHYEDGGNELRRVRVTYEGLEGLGAAGETEQELSSTGTIGLDERHAVRSIADEESLRVRSANGVFASRWAFAARRASTDALALRPVKLDDLDEATGASQLARDRQKERDERLSRGWDLGSIEVQLAVYGKGTHVDPKFVSSAAAYVRLHPEACDHLVAWFQDPRVTPLGRQLVMDVLSAAGSPEAQQAMRGALQTPEGRDPSLRGALVQRFVFVSNPTPESARYVAGLYDAARDVGDTRVAFRAAAALGAIIEHMSGAEELAAELDQKLRDDLAERRSPQETVALVLALGNARQQDDLEAIGAFAADARPEVREQVAQSLRWFDDPMATRALLDLVRDPVPAVDRSAVRALREQSLDDSDWESLAQAMEMGSFPSRFYAALVDLLEQRPDCGPERTARLLRLVLDRTPDTGGTRELRERAARLLSDLTA